MATVRELITKLSFDLDRSTIREYDSALGQVANRAKAIGSNLRRVGREISNIGRDLTFKLSLPIGIAAGVSIKAASDVEQLTVSFETMLGSVEAAKKMLKDLFDFAEKTPFTLPEVNASAKQLLAVGVSSDNVIPILKSLGDVAAGLNVPMSRLILNFGQIKTQGKLTGRELRDFAIAGVPLLEILATTLGKSKEQIQALVSDGAISFEMVKKAFVEMSSEGGRFANLMTKQSKTLGGLFSNLLDVLFRVRAEVGKIIVQEFRLKEVLAFVIRQIEKFVKVIKEMNPLLRKLILAFGAFLFALGPVLFIIGKLITSIGALLLITGFLKIALGAMGITLGALLLPFVKILAVIGAIAGAIFLVQDEIKAWRSGGRSVIGLILGDWETFRDKTKKSFNNIKEDFRQFWDIVKSIFTIAIDEIKKKIDELTQKLENSSIGNFVKKAKQIGGGIKDNVKEGFLPSAKQGLKGAFLASPFGAPFLAAKAFAMVGELNEGLIPKNFGQGITDKAAAIRQNNITMKNEINLQVPMGSLPEQANFLKSEMKQIADEQIGNQVRHVMTSNSEDE